MRCPSRPASRVRERHSASWWMNGFKGRWCEEVGLYCAVLAEGCLRRCCAAEMEAAGFSCDRSGVHSRRQVDDGGGADIKRSLVYNRTFCSLQHSSRRLYREGHLFCKQDRAALLVALGVACKLGGCCHIMVQ
jgi:hypothetical protein